MGQKEISPTVYVSEFLSNCGGERGSLGYLPRVCGQNHWICVSGSLSPIWCSGKVAKHERKLKYYIFGSGIPMFTFIWIYLGLSWGGEHPKVSLNTCIKPVYSNSYLLLTVTYWLCGNVLQRSLVRNVFLPKGWNDSQNLDRQRREYSCYLVGAMGTQVSFIY